MKRAIKAALLMSISCSAAMAQQPAQDAENAFDLGRIEEIFITRSIIQDVEMPISSSRVTADEIYTFERTHLDEAMALIPGTVATSSGGSRNERLIFVRGFDRFQVPISIDGIRIYLPADNRLDYGRYLTGDLAEIQVAKGYVSVLNGPGAIGGAINMVTRKPVREFEAEASARVGFDGDLKAASHELFALAGARTGEFYFQASGTLSRREYFTLSDDFEPTVNEDGGKRENSQTRDWRVNVKAGWQPGENEEYSISYTSQHGAKSAPLHVTDAIGSQRNWTWPYWDFDYVYALTRTPLADGIELKTRAYYNNFSNGLYAYDNATLTTQSASRAFRSYYDDYAYGGSITLSAELAPNDTVAVAGHYRRDNHVEWQDLFAPPQTEPKQTNREDTYSLALENHFRATEALELVAGISYDWRNLMIADDWTRTVANNPPPPRVTSSGFVHYPIDDGAAFNWQGAAIYDLGQSTLHASISSRSRFPTIADRFSTRFGGATSNPALDAERATNVEVGYAGPLMENIHAEGAIFYSSLDDVIAPVSLPAGPFGGAAGTFITQNQNLADGEYMGFEVKLTAALSDTIEVGGNYTYLDRDINDPNNSLIRPTGTPDHTAFLYATARLLPGLEVTPSVEIASSRWTSNTAIRAYYRTGDYAIANLGISYDVLPNVTISATSRNLFDNNYQFVDGFPEAGRSFSLALRAKY